MRNYKKMKNKFIFFTAKLSLLVLINQYTKELKTCSGFPNSEKLNNKLKENANYFPNTKRGSLESSTLTSNHLENSQACHYFQSSKRLMCNGSIDYAYLKAIKEEQIIDFVVEKYEAESLYKKKNWSLKNLETGEWYTKLPRLYQKLIGEVQLKDTGLQFVVSMRMLPGKDLKKFFIEGEVFSNKVIKISWRLKGDLYLDFIKNRTVIFVNAGAIGDSHWSIQSNLTFLKRSPQDKTDSWEATGTIRSDYVSENKFAFYKGTIWTVMKEECKFFGEVMVPHANVEASLYGTTSSLQQKHATIPKSAFSNMTIQNIIFKDSNFYNDFDRNSFEGLQGVKRITFIDSNLEILPKLDELFKNFSDLEQIFIEDCVIVRLKFSSLSIFKNIQKLSFKGSGPLTFNDLSFLWLKNSNLTSFSLRNSHVKISANASAVLRSVNDTLKYLDLSYSTLSEEKDLILILNNLNIESLMAEGLKLRKIPTVALVNVRKTLTYLSLRENDFRKQFEKNFFDSILNFPLMLSLRELNLEDCHINYIEKGVFDNLPNLKILHLSYNNLGNIQDGWTSITPDITYLDLSHNMFSPQLASIGFYDLGTPMTLKKFKNLKTLDLSSGIFTSINTLLNGLGSNLQNLSLRNTRLEELPEYIFDNLTGLEILDLSYNRNLKGAQPFSFNLFKKLINLTSLNLKKSRISRISLHDEDSPESQNADGFILKNLQLLDLSVNNLKKLDSAILRTFPKLKILNLSGNSITEWSTTMSFSDNLRTVFLDENKIETITSEMMSDIKTLEHVTLGNNPFACGSYVYEIIKLKNAVSEEQTRDRLDYLKLSNENGVSYFKESDFIQNMYYKTKKNQEITNRTNLKILDWSEKNYICFSYKQGKFIPFTEVNEDFQSTSRKKTEKAETTLLGLAIVIVAGIVITIAIICWKFSDINLITKSVRNAVALSFISRGEKEHINFKYNVFVSYSDKDRSWVFENLLPRLESKNDVKVCLHERDFEVGLSIIENILNSIESSRNIIFVVSQAFLKSQWCQYEMQLAQFRLLEKGRYQLILIFLENIPAVKRPKNLRYLMMTKTYLEWPLNTKNIKEIDTFWNRLTKSLMNLN